MKTFTFFFLETWHCLLLIWRSCGKSSPAKNNVTRPKLRLKISIATQIQLWRNLCPPFDTCEYCQRQRQSVERWLINLWQGNGINTDQILKGCETELRNWENIKNEKLSQTVFEGKNISEIRIAVDVAQMRFYPSLLSSPTHWANFLCIQSKMLARLIAVFSTHKLDF